MNRLKIAVLFGGNSFEHEVSLNSAYNVIKNLDEDEFEIFPIGITKKGEWFYYFGDVENIKTGDWEKQKNYKVVVDFDLKNKGFLKLKDGFSFDRMLIDCVFPVLHGQNGEDGRVQALFELAGIAYVGCASLSSSLCMNKVLTHTILDYNGIKGARWDSVRKNEIEKIDSKLLEISKKLSFPIFTKPAGCGSSVGIRKCRNLEEFKEGVFFALQFEDEVICEEFVEGKEVECAVLGGYENVVTSVVGEIIPFGDFYDFDSKYKNDSKLIIPATIEEKVSLKVREIATKAFKTMRCYGLSRVDFFVTKKDEIYLNEINTMPGFTNISMYAKLFEKSGFLYKEILKEVISLAIKRNEC